MSPLDEFCRARLVVTSRDSSPPAHDRRFRPGCRFPPSVSGSVCRPLAMVHFRDRFLGSDDCLFISDLSSGGIHTCDSSRGLVAVATPFLTALPRLLPVRGFRVGRRAAAFWGRVGGS